MSSTQRLANLSPRLLRIAGIARQKRQEVFTSLAHLVDVEQLQDAYGRCRKDGAVGVDDVSAEEYGKALSANLSALHERLRTGAYRAPPVLRAYVPKAQGGERPIGIPTVRDRVVQAAVKNILEPVFEADFYPCSYGFRPGRSAHQAVLAVREAVMSMRGAWVIDADIRSFFDSLDHRVLNSLLDRRIRDGAIRRLIGRWLKAGVMEQGEWKRMARGTPQGGVISPLLANVFLHYVLDVVGSSNVLRVSLTSFAPSASSTRATTPALNDTGTNSLPAGFSWSASSSSLSGATSTSFESSAVKNSRSTMASSFVSSRGNNS
jgi:RNA-directed DNA polymerase